MDVATITMPKEVAREKLKAYRQATHKDAEEQYRQCAEGYKALAAGTPLINIDDAFRSVALDEKGRPKLAIARADRAQVKFTWGDSTEATFDTQFNHPAHVRAASFWRRVNMGRFHEFWNRDRTWRVQVSGFAIVPMVPADVRPPCGKLADLFILWEVDQWADSEIGAKAPVDPMLLKHIGGSLYAVLAEWDLTPLERAILEGSMQSR